MFAFPPCRLNGEECSPRRGSSPPPAGVREVSLTESDLESVAVLYGGLKSIRTRLSPEDDARLTDKFDGHIRAVMGSLQSRLDALSDPFQRQAEIIMVLHSFFHLSKLLLYYW